MNDWQLTREDAALVADLRRALVVVTATFADAMDARDWDRAEKWAAIGFGLVRLMEGQRADA